MNEASGESATAAELTSAEATDQTTDQTSGQATDQPAGQGDGETTGQALTPAPDTPAPAAAAADPSTHRFECRSCGFVYDPAEGVKKVGIEPGTPFLELDPLSFRCPVCRSKVGAFKDIGPRDKPSGFEENLNYGLGVNRLTPGQKNVLIFGAFALAIAFFLSLYSLR
ncbi:MAG: rubredoxin [Cyanobium sp.]